MKLSKAYPVHLPLTRPIVVSEAQSVVPSVPLSPLFLPGSRLFVGPGLYGLVQAQVVPKIPAAPAASQAPVAPASATPVAQPDSPESTGPTLVSLATSVGIGFGIAKPLVQLTALPNTMSSAALASHLVNYNVAPASADTVATAILDFAKSRPGKTVFLGLAGGALTLAVVEALAPHWSWKRKLIYAVIGGAIVALVVLVLLSQLVLR